MKMRYNGGPDSETIAEYAHRFKYDEARKQKIFEKINPNAYSSEEIVEKMKQLNKEAWRKEE